MREFWETIHWMKALKIAVGAVVAILLAEMFGLQNAASAGIITLLTVQNTRLETVKGSVRRFATFGVMTILSLPVYHIFGTQPWAFGIVLLLLLLCCYLLHFEDAVPINAVMATHYMLAGGVSWQTTGNAVLLLFIGSGIGVCLNWFMPCNQKKIEWLQYQLDEEIRGNLHWMAKRIRTVECSEEGNSCFVRIEKLASKLQQEIMIYLQNQTWKKDVYFMWYVSMRKEQCTILREISKQILQLTKIPEQAEPLSQFIEKMASQFHEGNDCAELLESLEDLYMTYRKQPLPNTRDSFENRSVLYCILIDLRTFLQVKREFYLSLPEQEQKRIFEKFICHR